MPAPTLVRRVVERRDIGGNRRKAHVRRHHIPGRDRGRVGRACLRQRRAVQVEHESRHHRD